jgi:Cof subfamily protein (haloacid dehalogenase superfamily)
VIQLIGTDLDGTLLNDEGSVSPRNQEALAAARSADIRVVVVTARSHYTAAPILDELVEVDRAVCSNGATIFDTETRRIVREHSIEPAAVADLFAGVTSGVPGTTFGWETAEALIWESHFADLHPRPGAVVGDRPSLGVNKVLVAHPEVTGHDLLRELHPHLNGGVTASNSGADFVEVTAAGVDKAFGLGVVCEEWGIASDQVIAFGDQLNDVPMLRWAGTGVAMANAHPEALAAADRVTTTNVEDGVAQVIEALL